MAASIPPPQPISQPPWVELPREITGLILHKLGAVQILKTAQMVCKTWWSVSLDPAMWRVIDMRLDDEADLIASPYHFAKTCRLAVDRSQGQLVDISIEFFATDDLLDYIAQRYKIYYQYVGIFFFLLVNSSIQIPFLIRIIGFFPRNKNKWFNETDFLGIYSFVYYLDGYFLFENSFFVN